MASHDADQPWDARIARRLVTPLKDTWVSPNHLTTLRLLLGLGAAAAFVPGTYRWSNAGAWAFFLSNFIDHTDGELARISGKSSPIGHLYDLASDATVTILLFVAIGAGLHATVLGALAGCAVAAIFHLRMRIEELHGKSATRQASFRGFETEDVLYLLPLVTLCNAVAPFLLAAAIGAPVFALWVAYDFWRVRSAEARVSP
jgi:phosphatidylglycerophosphate synthase